MDIDSVSIITGAFFAIIILIVRAFNLRHKFLEKTNLLISLGHILFSFTSAFLFVKMVNLAILTITDSLTLEIIKENKNYVFVAWVLLALGALIAYFSIVLENRNKA